MSAIRKKEITNQLQNLEVALKGFGSPSMAKTEYEVARETVRMWKFNKALYEQYGGRVIFQQAGLEPIDAYRAWLQEHERNGDFQIVEPQLRDQFWSYFLSDGHDFIFGVSPEQDNAYRQESHLKHPFEQPWWLVKND